MEKYKDEVEQRWGKEAYADSSQWWNSKTDEEQQAWQDRKKTLSDSWKSAALRGVDPSSTEAQDVARQHVAWLESIPGTPGYEDRHAPDEYVLGLAQMYVEDERFAANYGGATGATFVRESLRVFVSTRGN